MVTKVKTILLAMSILTVGCTSLRKLDVQHSGLASSDTLEVRTFAFNFASDAERKQAEKLALQGDAAAAERLSRYYAAIKRDRAETGRWDMIAVLNGSSSAQISMASQLYRMQNEEAWNYAGALLERASSKGDKRALQMLKEHPQTVETWRRLRNEDREKLRKLGYEGSLLSDL